MSFEPENELERALVRASGDATYADGFYRRLIDEDLLFIQQPGSSDTNDSVGIATLDIDGTAHLPIFSSLSRLQEAIDREVTYAAVNGLELLRMTSGLPLVLNPASEYGKQITAAEAAAIIDGSIFETDGRKVLPAGSTYLIGEPKNYPSELVEVLQRMFAERPAIIRAWVAQIMIVDADTAPNTLVGIESDKDLAALVTEARNVLQHVNIAEATVDFVPVGDPDDIGGYFLDKAPFYSRKER